LLGVRFEPGIGLRPTVRDGPRNESGRCDSLRNLVGKELFNFDAKIRVSSASSFEKCGSLVGW
jgi:hypothetical protein